MKSITERVMEVRGRHEPKAKQSWQKQQDYYQRLKKAGIAKQQTYNLAPLASI